MTPDKTPSDALAPCPFCGAPAHGYAIEPHSHSPAVLRLVPELPDHPGSYVIEGQCACGSGLIGANEAEVVARWNTRWGSPVVAGEVAAHRVMRKQLDGNLVCDGRYWSDGPPSKELVESICSDKDRWRVDVAYTTPQPTQAQAGAVLDLNAAAKMLAERMDYPWEHMPEQGRAEMRKHAQAVIGAAYPLRGKQ